MRTGKNFNCRQCGKNFYRSPAQIKAGSYKTCSKDCASLYYRGKRAPFWNKKHKDASKTRISKARKGKALGNQNAAGYKHTEEARKKISAASKRLWKECREQMISSLPKGWNNANYKPPELRRHRKHFTPKERREWKSSQCFYCGSKKDLVLDHIVPIFDGGVNHKDNCQTLCRACNLWKLRHVDLPRYYATLAIQGD